MALIKCHECSADVSTTAKACPKCGAKVIAPKVKKPATAAQKVIAGLAAVAVVGVILSTQQHQEEAAQAAADPTVQAQRAKEAQRNTIAIMALKSVKGTLRNPASVQWDRVLVSDDNSAVCIEYRTQNGFGGMNKESVTFADGKIKRDSESWNKLCANNPLNDVKDFAVRMLDRV